MVEINDGYNKLKFSIDNYINKKFRKFNMLRRTITYRN